MTDTLWLSLFLMLAGVVGAIAFGTFYGAMQRIEDERADVLEARRQRMKARIAEFSRTWSA